MLFTTATEWAALALTFLGGWLLGLASHPGGRKWRDRYNAERDAHAASRRDAEMKLTAADARIRELEEEHGRLSQHEARVAELERERAALIQANARITELERENARLGRGAPAVVAAPATAHPHPSAEIPAAAPAQSAPITRRVGAQRQKRGWFDWGPGSDPRARRV